jgi:hypothetical protein
VRNELEAKKTEPKLLVIIGARVTSVAAKKKYEAINAIKANNEEWAVQVDSHGGQHTLTLELEQRARVLGIGISHGTRGRVFTQMRVHSESMNRDDNLVTLPLGQKEYSTCLTTPIEGQMIHVQFSQNSVVGDSGSAGLKY